MAEHTLSVKCKIHREVNLFIDAETVEATPEKTTVFVSTCPECLFEKSFEHKKQYLGSLKKTQEEAAKNGFVEDSLADLLSDSNTPT